MLETTPTLMESRNGLRNAELTKERFASPAPQEARWGIVEAGHVGEARRRFFDRHCSRG